MDQVYNYISVAILVIGNIGTFVWFQRGLDERIKQLVQSMQHRDEKFQLSLGHLAEKFESLLAQSDKKTDHADLRLIGIETEFRTIIEKHVRLEERMYPLADRIDEIEKDTNELKFIYKDLYNRGKNEK